MFTQWLIGHIRDNTNDAIPRRFEYHVLGKEVRLDIINRDGWVESSITVDRELLERIME